MDEKKPAVLMVLDTLIKYSSHTKRLTQSEIIELISKDCGNAPDRKTVRNALELLAESRLKIGYTETDHAGKKIKSQWYYKGKVSPESALIIAGALLCGNSPDLQDAERILDELGFDLNEISEWTELFTRDEITEEINVAAAGNISVIAKACADNKMIRFSVLDYRTPSGERRFLTDSSGSVLRYLVKPLKIVSRRNRLCLLSEIGDSGYIRYFPLDKISSPEITGIDNRKQNNMYRKNEEIRETHKREKIVILVDSSVTGEVFDCFGTQNTELLCKYGEKSELVVRAEFKEVLTFVLGKGSVAELISPTKYRRLAARELKKAYGKYLTVKKYTGYLS